MRCKQRVVFNNILSSLIEIKVSNSIVFIYFNGSTLNKT